MNYYVTGYEENKNGIMIGERINRTPFDDFVIACKVMIAISPVWSEVKVFNDENERYEVIAKWKGNYVYYDNKIFHEDEFIAYLEILRVHVGHLDSFERIIKRFINKRDVLKTILTNPVFNINFTDEEMLKFKYQYEILEELLKGVE